MRARGVFLDSADVQGGRSELHLLPNAGPPVPTVVGRACRPPPGAEVTLRVHLGAGDTVHVRRVRSHDRARGDRGQAGIQGAPAHAAACLRLRPGQQVARHPCLAGLPRAPQHSAHRQVHRIVADPVQGFLAKLRLNATPVGEQQMSIRVGRKNAEPRRAYDKEARNQKDEGWEDRLRLSVMPALSKLNGASGVIPLGRYR
jgi:hypothetical protein